MLEIYPIFYLPQKNYFDIFKNENDMGKSTRLFEKMLNCEVQSLDDIFLYFKEKIIVTMTSWKERINYVSRVLEILINNSFRQIK